MLPCIHSAPCGSPSGFIYFTLAALQEEEEGGADTPDAGRLVWNNSLKVCSGLSSRTHPPEDPGRGSGRHGAESQRRRRRCVQMPS